MRDKLRFSKRTRGTDISQSMRIFFFNVKVLQNFFCMSRRVPVFSIGSRYALYFYQTKLQRNSDGAFVNMDVESLDNKELRRSVTQLCSQQVEAMIFTIYVSSFHFTFSLASLPGAWPVGINFLKLMNRSGKCLALF